MFIILSCSFFCNYAIAGKYTGNSYLISAEEKQKKTADELKQQFRMFSSYIRSGYTGYRITYRTTDGSGQQITASGALFIPDSGRSFPLLNYNHGTIFPSKESTAPSYLQTGFELMIGKLFASAGYIVAMPDYAGYGAAKNSSHPYGAYHVIAVNCTDMLYAVKEFCASHSIGLSGKNFFSGWSEGAAVALATVKKLQDDQSSIQATASVLNAGPYYTSGFTDHVLNAKGDLKYINSYAWVLATYNRIYDINKPLNYYFNDAVASEIEKNPEAKITHDPSLVFKKSFVDSYLAGNETTLKKAMELNDLWNWKPTSPIVFCHGDKDDYVPIFNSEKAYEAMKESGCMVTLRVLKGQTHGSGVYSFLMEAFKTFEESK